MTASEFIRKDKGGPEKLYCIGTDEGSSFVFVGTKWEYFHYISIIEARHLAYLEQTYSNALGRRDYESARKLREKIDSFVPYSEREVVDIFERDWTTNPFLSLDGAVNVIIKGNELGRFWFRDECLGYLNRKEAVYA